MRPEFVDEFGIVERDAGTALESRSGAAVREVGLRDGQNGFLKVTPAGAGLAAARRELRFYRSLAPITPVRTPRLLGAVDDEDGIVLLLSAAGSPVAAGAWTVRMWADLGRALAALHSMPLPVEWDRTPLGPAPELENARAFWGPVLPRLDELLERRAELTAPTEEAVLIHGDCHTDNVLHSEGELAFCDWQAAGPGRAVTDLALLSVRATPGGVTVPPALVDSYRERRPGLSHRALIGEELSILLFQWPPFAGFNSPAGIGHIHRRAQVLAELWLG